MVSRSEIPIEDFEDHPAVWSHTVVTELEALARSMPFVSDMPSTQEALALREHISVQVEKLEPRKRYIVESVIYGQRLSYRKIGKELSISKSQIHRLYKEALEDLRPWLQSVID